RIEHLHHTAPLRLVARHDRSGAGRDGGERGSELALGALAPRFGIERNEIADGALGNERSGALDHDRPAKLAVLSRVGAIAERNGVAQLSGAEIDAPEARALRK